MHSPLLFASTWVLHKHLALRSLNGKYLPQEPADMQTIAGQHPQNFSKASENDEIFSGLAQNLVPKQKQDAVGGVPLTKGAVGKGEAVKEQKVGGGILSSSSDNSPHEAEPPIEEYEFEDIVRQKEHFGGPDKSAKERDYLKTRHRSALHSLVDTQCVEGGGGSSVVTTGLGIPGTHKVWVKTYGCSHNRSDTEYMMGILGAYGYTFVADMERADICLLNSCTVKNPSQDALTSLVEAAKTSSKPIVIAGCVPQAERTIPSLKDVSLIGVTQIDRIVEVVEQTLAGNTVRLLSKKKLPSLDLPKIRRNSIIEIVPLGTGCLGSCTYCKTKHARGKLGSYSVSAILGRIERSLAEGVKQIWLTSEDTGAYGLDLNTNIVELVESIVRLLPDDTMLRIGMTNPPYIKRHLEAIGRLMRHPRVFEFIHIPVQSGSNETLQQMGYQAALLKCNWRIKKQSIFSLLTHLVRKSFTLTKYREYTVEDFDFVVASLKASVPDITIATDIICGFPSESDVHHSETIKLISKHLFPVLNISQFYPRPGTKAASMKRIPSKIVKQRSTEVTNLFNSYTTFESLLHTTQLVWFSENSEKSNHTVGHTKQYVKVLTDRDDSLLGSSAWIYIVETHKWHIIGRRI